MVAVPERLSSNTTGFSEESLYKLRNLLHMHHFPQGSILFSEGEPANQFFLIVKGQIKVTKSTHEGKEMTLYLLNKGDLYGEWGASVYYPFQAVANSDSSIGTLAKTDIEKLLQKNHHFTIEFMNWLSLFHRITQSKYRDLLLNDKNGALSCTLIRLSNVYGHAQPDGSILFNTKITNEAIAEMIGATRESVNRLLGQLRDNGVIALDHGYLKIYDLNHLKSVCHCEECSKDICRL